MQENRVHISKISEGLKKYAGQLIGTATMQNLGAIFLMNCIIESRALPVLKMMADEKGGADLEVIRRNALEALDKLPGQCYVFDIPLGKMTINKKAVEDICKIICAPQAG